MTPPATPSLVGRGRSAVVVTACAVLTQCFAIVAQLQIAALFGAGAEVDAYLAGITVPQVVIAVVNGSVTFVLMPVFIGHLNAGNIDKAWSTLVSVIAVSTILLGSLSVIGVSVSPTLIGLLFPGFGPEEARTAAMVSFVAWPTVVVTVIGTLLASAYQANARFSWPALVPMLVAIANVAAIAILCQWLGIVGVPIASLLTAIAQLLLLSRILIDAGGRRPNLQSSLRFSEAKDIFLLSWPLLASGLLVRSTPVIDRYIASGLSEGAISHLGYASRLSTLIAALLSTGVATVVYPLLAWNAAREESAALGTSLAQACRLIWLVVAPVAVVGQFLSRPAIETLLVRGDFSSSDAEVVAALLRIYLFALAGMTLGNVTARVFYALRKTAIPAWAGVVEAIAYAIYTPLLARQFGIEGVAWGFVIYYTASLTWQGLWLALHVELPRSVLRSFITTALASTLAGAAALVSITFFAAFTAQLIMGFASAVAVFGLAMAILGKGEIDIAKQFLATGATQVAQPIVTPSTLG